MGAEAAPARVVERVRNKVLASVDGCWWSLYSTGSHGYAQVGWQENGGRYVTLAHRVAWFGARGPIPAGLTVDHTCKNRQCVNVEHMRLLTNFENARRTSGRDWPLGECAQGHSNAHLRRNAGGHLECGICRREWHSASNAKRGSKNKVSA